MQKQLDINLYGQPNCKLVSTDNTNYESSDLAEHVMIEFLSYSNDNFHLIKSVRILQEPNEKINSKFSSKFTLEKDGIYYYYKLVVPTLSHLTKTGSQYNNELYFDNGKLYKYDSNKSEEVDNYIDAYNLVQDNAASQTFYCPKKVIFTACNLQKCLVSLQKKLLFSNSCTCSYEKCKTDETLRNHRDFLLSALYVLDYLKKIGNIEEAQRILDNLSSCNSICGDEDRSNGYNKDCGCGSFA